MWGKYRAGILEGTGKIQLIDNYETILEGRFVNGKLHGPVRGFGFKEGLLTLAGRFKNGHPVGNFWKGIIYICMLLFWNLI